VVAGIGLATGPLVGGLLADHGDWRWVFYFNVPLGVVVLVGALLALRLPRGTEQARLDFAGAALAAAFASAVLLVCDWGGKQYPWTSPTILVLGAGALLCLGLFIWRQATAAEPILPLALFANLVVRRAYLVQSLVAVAMTAALVYLMVYLQVGRGLSATDAGTFLAFMALGLGVSGLLAGRLALSTRGYLVVGTLLAAIALTAMARLTLDTPLWTIRAELVVLGLGLGQVLGRLIQVVQSAAPPAQLGVATTAIRFFQSLGGAAGAALFGSVLTRAYSAKASDAGASGVSLSGIGAAADHVRAAALESLVSGVDAVFAGTAAFMVLALILAVRLKEARAATD
jgi:predicted MFS family arabinose efflux permease